jgi:hypothetical protein
MELSLGTRVGAVTRLVALAVVAVTAAGGQGALPNLVELPPSSLEVEHGGGHDVLRFTSTVANTGTGALVVISTRPGRDGAFASVQLVGRRRIPLAVQLRYRRSGGHDHFHLVGFERYELRDARGRLVARDHKVGFCLSDRQSLGRARPHRTTSDCGRGHPRARRVVQGLSPGYADPYDADLGGQSFDVTGLPAGEYVLVNVVNPLRAFDESDYGDDAASVRFVLARPPAPAGIAFVRVLAVCRSVRCPA